MQLRDISMICDKLEKPLGRKYCLNFAYASGFEVNALKLADLFNPEKFMVKITPIHNTASCRDNGIETINGYNSYTPYQDVEGSLLYAGFDVLVFIPSLDEETGYVTCGNAILSHKGRRYASQIICRH
jgi:23S rRNA (adenine2503-C2)-methyltransferase